MATMLTMSDIEELVAGQAAQLDQSMSRDQVHVYEDPYASREGSLIVQIATRSPENRKGWIERQLRLSHDIRDALLERGDERYPLIEIFEPEEWATRND